MNNNLALLLTTSGTTGSPKLVRLSYKNYENGSKDIISTLKLKNNELKLKAEKLGLYNRSDSIDKITK